MIKTKFVFAVSLVAMMAVNSVFANAATGDAVGTAHTVFTDLTPTSNADGKNPGIAGVTYVNRAVNSAGSAAKAAEAHAASAGASALSAAESAAAAAQSATNANNSLGSKENAANKKDAYDDNWSTDNKQQYFPTVNLTESMIADANNDVMDSVNAKLASVTTTGTGTVIKSIAKKGTAVEATLGSIVSADITDGTISNADIASGAAIAQSKISGLTTSLNAKEATANKLTSTAATTVNDTNKDTLFPTVGKAQAMIDAKVNALDVSDSAVSGQYVSAVSEADGKITVTRASLPTVNDATLTIQKNGSTIDTFTANSSANKTVNITVPTGALASKSTISNADVADNAAIAASKISGLAKVATSGSYTDLSDKPTIPTVNNATLTIQKNGSTIDTFTANSSANKTVNITVPTGALASKSTISNADVADNAAIAASKISGLAEVATSGSYTDLSDKPTINNATLTIQKNGSTVATFSANSGTAATANITVPTGTLASKNTISNADVADNAAIAQSKISGLTTSLNSKEEAANKKDAYVDSWTADNKKQYFPTVNLTESMIADANNDVMDSVNAKLASVTTTGSGTVIKSITKDGTAVKGTLGSIVSSDITDGAVATADIANGAVTVAKTTGLYGVIPSGSQGNTAATANIWVE